MYHTSLRCVLFLMLIVLTGCSGSEYVPVSGIVKLDGKPLENAVVFFQPMGTSDDAGGVGSSGKTDAEGRYTLQASTLTATAGALVGKHRVRIGSVAAAGEAIDMTADAVNPGNAKNKTKTPKDIVPTKYNTDSTLDFDVPSGGTDQANFDLMSK